MKIKEVIVVEGRADESAVKKAVDAEIIILSGFGISEGTFQRIQTAYERKGIIILTDPDFAGEKIRKRLIEKYPNAKHAYLSKEDATKDQDIGVENASIENISYALEKARCEKEAEKSVYTLWELQELGLSGSVEASQRRDILGGILGIGYGNTKTFIKRLNHYGITVEELKQALETLNRREKEMETK